MSGHECRKFSNFNAFTALNIVDGRGGGGALALAGRRKISHLRVSVSNGPFTCPRSSAKRSSSRPRVAYAWHCFTLSRRGWLITEETMLGRNFQSSRRVGQLNFSQMNIARILATRVYPRLKPRFPSSVLCRPLKAFMARFLDVLLFTNGSSRRINSERGRTSFTSFSCACGISRTLFLDERNFLLLD